jgi:hypothetical protein
LEIKLANWRLSIKPIVAVILLTLWLLGSIGGGALVGFVVSSGKSSLDLNSAYIDGRTLTVWEAEGRGPIRDVTITAGSVINSTGDEGQIRLETKTCNKIVVPLRTLDCSLTAGNVISPTTLDPGAVLSVPILSVNGLKQPGIYQGRILIQSPDIEGGVVEVPVQITVHDFIFWAGLVILLGVVAGAYSRYLAEGGRQKLVLRRRIECVWQEWDDNIPYDRLGAGMPGSIYEKVRRDLNRATDLLDQESEWGLEDATSKVDDIEQRLVNYKRLSSIVSDLRRASVPDNDQVLKPKLNELEDALSQGDIRLATDQMSEILRWRLPELLKQIGEVNTTIKATNESIWTEINALAIKSDDLRQKENYLEAWTWYTEARSKLLTVVHTLPQVEAHSDMYMKMMVARTRSGEPSIQIQPARVNYRVGENLLLQIIGGEEWAAEEVVWRAMLDNGSDPDTLTNRIGLPPSAYWEPPTVGQWTITAQVTGKQAVTMPLKIIPSRQDMLYREKRQHEFNRQILAGLLALIGGAVANRVFGFTFGALEEYLVAFTWGVGVSYGVSQFSPGYAALKTAIGKLTPTEAPPEKPPGT